LKSASIASEQLKVDDIRPHAFAKEHRRALDEDVRWLADRISAFVEVVCPACGGSHHRPLYGKYGLRHVLCAFCGTQYVSPRPPPELLAEFYERSAVYRFWSDTIYPSSSAARREHIFRPRARMVDELCTREGISGGTLVEIGAAYGLFCEEVRDLGRFDHIVAVEPVPTLAAVCREKGFDVVQSAVERAALVGPVDVACSFEVIEHLFSPFEFLTGMFALLRSGGHVMVSCPNIQGFDTLVLGARSDTVDHEHLNYYSPASLRLLAERVGFERVSVTTPGRLDVEIIATALREGLLSAVELGPFLSKVVTAPSLGAAFQQFLAGSGLSSSMLLVARKP
jgi:2-polyprenyl-3-methyl-5-hydroxy-6-metoxy-1,4-benzoquinol methylase